MASFSDHPLVCYFSHRLQLPGKGRNAKKFERQPSKDRLHASGAGGVGAGLGDMDVFEQDELFNMDGMLADNDLLAAGGIKKWRTYLPANKLHVDSAC